MILDLWLSGTDTAFILPAKVFISGPAHDALP